MKKTLLLLASTALLLVSCAKEQVGPGAAGDGDMVDVNITAGTAELTKAAIDHDGQAAYVTRWIMEVRDGSGDVYSRKVDTEDAGTLQHTFNIKLFKNQQYTFAFWADNGGEFYDASDLSAVKYVDGKSVVAGADAKDAFSGVETLTFSESISRTITLYRPFAQLNVITKDLKDLRADAISDNAYNAFKPKNFKATITVPTQFNVLSGEASEEIELILSADEFYGKDPLSYEKAPAQATMFMAYIFATKGEKDIRTVNFKFDVDSQTGNNTFEFTDVPFQRNYRTNILGNFLSGDAEWTVQIDTVWSGEYDRDFVAEGSVAAANQALKEGKNSIEISAPEDYSTPVSMPAQADGKDISVKVTGVSGKAMTFIPADDAQGPANLYITTDAQDLVINLPNSHVEVNGGTYQTVEATTSANTLVVGKEVTIETLTINGGNAAIYGLVNTINKQASTVVDFYVSAAAGLRSVAEKISAAPGGKDFYGKVYLTADIDLDNEEWTPIAAFQKPLAIDGQGYTIKNLKVTESTAAYIGFIGTACGLTVKNLNFDTVILSYPSTVGENARGGVIAGQVYGATIENCSVKNVKITACQKVGGLLGYIEGNTNVPHIIKNCSVENVSIKSNDPAKILQHGAGGFIGHISLSNNPLVSISGCSVKDVTIADFGTAPYTSSELQRVPHAFIGNVCNNHTGTEVADITSHSVVLSNNSISGTNTVLPTCMYSSNYFGWAGNAEERATWKGGIYIDGEAWTPDYPAQIKETGVKYTLDKALAAATSGQTVQILKAGDYTVQILSTKAAVVEATVEGVVFNHTAGYKSWVSAQDGHIKTVKNITWNVGEANYQYFNNTNLENCTVNGQLCTHGSNKFKDCTFINEKGYNFWVYGNEYTEFDNCTFTCPGKNDGVAGCGSALNCYNEAAQTPTPVLVIKNCTFTAKESSDKYSALYIKPETAFDIQITNSTCNDNFCTGAISGSKLWNLKANREGTTVSIDGKMVYPFCSKDAYGNYHIINADGLLQFHDLYAAGKVAYTAKVYLDNDIDFTGKTWTVLDWHADYATKGFALFDGQNHTIKNFTISGQGMFSRWAGGATPYFKDIVFDGAKNVTSSLNVSLFCGQVYQNAKIENVTIKNSQIEGTYKVAPFVGTVYDENAGRTVTLTLKDCKVENTTVRGTAYDFDICGMVAWVNESNNDKITFEGDNVVKDVTLYIPAVTYNQCAKIYHNGDTAYDEVANVSVSNVNVVIAQ